jgi:hypothetical protein
MNMQRLIGHTRTVALMTVCAMFSLTGCGGGSLEEYGQDTSSVNTQSHANTVNQPVGDARANMASRADTGSFTLNPTSQFNGFNPGIWNDAKSWDECDCGDQSKPLPKTMPWNKAG